MAMLNMWAFGRFSYNGVTPLIFRDAESYVGQGCKKWDTWDTVGPYKAYLIEQMEILTQCFLTDRV